MQQEQQQTQKPLRPDAAVVLRSWISIISARWQTWDQARQEAMYSR
jgi:hypothetical protein